MNRRTNTPSWRPDGSPTAFTANGFARFTARRDAAKVLEEVVQRLHHWQVDVRSVGADELARAVPWARWDDLEGAILSPKDAVVTPSAITEIYAEGARSRGIDVDFGTPFGSLSADGPAWLLERGGRTVRAGRIVVAAGAWSKKILASLHHPLPLAPYRTQAAVLRPTPGGPALFPSVHDVDLDVYVRPEDQGRILAGDGTELVEVDPDRTSGGGDKKFLTHLAESFGTRFPGWADAELVRAWAGVCTSTPDRRPLIGPVPGAAGLFVLTGFNGFGVMRAGGVARRLAAWLAAGEGSVPERDALQPGPYRSAFRGPRRWRLVLASRSKREIVPGSEPVEAAVASVRSLTGAKTLELLQELDAFAGLHTLAAVAEQRKSRRLAGRLRRLPLEEETEGDPFPPTEREALALELIERLEGDRGHDPGQLVDRAREQPDLLLRVGVEPEREEVEQVVQVGLPVPLGVVGDREDQPGGLPSDAGLERGGVGQIRLLGDPVEVGTESFHHLGRKRVAAALSVPLGLVADLLRRRHLVLVGHDRVPGAVLVHRRRAVADPLAGDEDGEPDQELVLHHLERSRVAVAHQIANEAPVVAHRLRALAVGDPGRLDDRGSRCPCNRRGRRTRARGPGP